MRKKKKQIKRLEKAKTKATNILENENMEHHEKIKEMKKYAFICIMEIKFLELLRSMGYKNGSSSE